MRRIADLPVPVRVVEDLRIPARDGTRLAARAFLPADPGLRVPAILEFIPYRKRDMTALRDTGTHAFLAGHGYAGIRLDARGTGDSEGIYGDQFQAQYVEDAADAIAWLAAQPWCDGKVAMFGLSWGAAIALQTAAARPPALAAIVCAAGIDDRYEHRWPGGCLSTATASAIVAQISYATRPPDPAIAGPGWKAAWLQRLEAARPVGTSWLAPPPRGTGWRAGALADRPDAITCPVLLTAGWSDPAFASAMLRTLGHLRVPRLGLFGPWAHRYPHLGIPGPAIDWLGETLRFLDFHLKGIDTGISREPMLRAFLPEGGTLSATPVDREGRWVGEATWPSAAPPLRLRLGTGGLTLEPQAETRAAIPGGLAHGDAAGEGMPLFSSARGPELWDDQRAEDAAALSFDGTPLSAPLDLLGIPRLRLALDGATGRGHVVARLCAVAPDGSSRRLAWGASNLAGVDAAPHFDDPRSVEIALYGMGERVPAGWRLRLSLQTSYWPLLWPSASAADIAVSTAGCELLLPLAAGDPPGTVPGEPVAAPTLTWTTLRPGEYRRTRSRDPATGEEVLELVDDMGEGRIEEIGTRLTERSGRRFRIRPDAPASAALETSIACGFARDGWQAGTVVTGRIARDGDGFVAAHTLTATLDGAEVFRRSFEERIASPA